jgi:hypothetical protein
VNGSSKLALRDAMAVFGKALFFFAVSLRAKKAFRMLLLTKLQTRRIDWVLHRRGRRAS